MLKQDQTIRDPPGGVVGLGAGVCGERGCNKGSSEGGEDGNSGIDFIGGKGEGEGVGSGGGEDDGGDGLGGRGLGLGFAAQCVGWLRWGQLTVDSRILSLEHIHADKLMDHDAKNSLWLSCHISDQGQNIESRKDII